MSSKLQLDVRHLKQLVEAPSGECLRGKDAGLAESNGSFKPDG